MFHKISTKLLILSVFLLTGTAVNGQTTSINVPDEWQTFAERTDYRQTARYPETIAFARRLASSSPQVSFTSMGKSPEGWDIPLLIVSEDGVSTAEQARRSKTEKAVILIQAAIHAGESDGKDAGLALLRDIAVTGEKRALLKDAVILFIPIYNVDGHELFSKYNRINQNGPEEMGFRANSANQNLNRDYLKADNPETRAWLKLWNEWKPDLFIDCHVTDGADYRYNITWEYARHQEMPSVLTDWMAEHFQKRVVPRVEEKGNLLSPYLQFADRGDPTKGIFSFVATPRFATGYTPLQNRIGRLIEAHSLKDYRSRVRGTYDLLEEMIREAGQSKDSLIAANRAADESAMTRGKDEQEFPLAMSIEREPSRQYLLKGVEIRLEPSGVSGSDQTIYGNEAKDYQVPWYDDTKVTRSVVVPSYYVLPPQWTDAIDRLTVHGVEFFRLSDETELEVEGYIFKNPKWADSSFEGRISLQAESETVTGNRVFPKNSVVVPLAQRASAVAIHLLEPSGPDSLFYWGFFNAIFESKEYAESYVLEKMAARMLREDSSLRREFDEKLKDEEFAKNPRARLYFFYERSGFKERTGIYPVGRIVDPEVAKRLTSIGLR
ncbi:MAG: peptidase M14 [Acidobacteria bacterium]|nr:MAG: peptidase M14 [Acidobacteriota bacterium]REK01864.1 MAG: peptidase M14 [Acidobacteriota bacterium]REK14820.1 MAG: peptidase M14 [Acidobacteriota bacterium]REK45535.1 MAG: peptidase M14 [Acidobacteriota bacterium]